MLGKIDEMKCMLTNIYKFLENIEHETKCKINEIGIQCDLRSSESLCNESPLNKDDIEGLRFSLRQRDEQLQDLTTKLSRYELQNHQPCETPAVKLEEVSFDNYDALESYSEPQVQLQLHEIDATLDQTLQAHGEYNEISDNVMLNGSVTVSINQIYPNCNADVNPMDSQINSSLPVVDVTDIHSQQPGPSGRTTKCICEYCGRVFASKVSSKYHAHMRTHTGEKPYVCSQCGRCFSQKASWEGHMRLHTGEKPFKCENCGKAFRDRSNMKVHMRMHSGEKPFHCHICLYAFYDQSNYNKHMKKKHGCQRPQSIRKD